MEILAHLLLRIENNKYSMFKIEKFVNIKINYFLYIYIIYLVKYMHEFE